MRSSGLQRVVSQSGREFIVIFCLGQVFRDWERLEIGY